MKSTQDTFFQKDDMLYTMMGVGITGALAILVAGILGYMSNRKSDSSDLTMNGGTEMQSKGDQNGGTEKNGYHDHHGIGDKEHEDVVTRTLRGIATCTGKKFIKIEMQKYTMQYIKIRKIVII